LRLYARIAETEFIEPRGSAARDCDFTALLVSDIRLAAKLGAETANDNPTAIATTCNLGIVILVANANLSAGAFHRNGEKRAPYLQPLSSHLSVTG
jgi:hypothetical protein